MRIGTQVMLGAIAGFVVGFLWERRQAKAWERAWWHDYESYRRATPVYPPGPGGKMSP